MLWAIGPLFFPWFGNVAKTCQFLFPAGCDPKQDWILSGYMILNLWTHSFTYSLDILWTHLLTHAFTYLKFRNTFFCYCSYSKLACVIYLHDLQLWLICMFLVSFSIVPAVFRSQHDHWRKAQISVFIWTVKDCRQFITSGLMIQWTLCMVSFLVFYFFFFLWVQKWVSYWRIFDFNML